jgi:hypothetical protein
LWLPRGYDARTAGIVVYVHGLYDNVDQAWANHHLAEQFAASRRNALFIAPEAPVAGRDPPLWESLLELTEQSVRRLTKAGKPRPRGSSVVVVGHSGAFRTLVLWLEEPIEHLILLDALYGNEEEFAAWIDSAEPRDHTFDRHLVVVAYDTLRWSEPFADRFPDLVLRTPIPTSASELSSFEKDARILYMPSQYGHMEIVTEGRTIPVLLAATRLPTTARPR